MNEQAKRVESATEQEAQGHLLAMKQQLHWLQSEAKRLRLDNSVIRDVIESLHRRIHDLEADRSP